MDEYQIKQLGSYLQDLGRYLIEHPEMIESAKVEYNPDLKKIFRQTSFISYENACTLSVEVVTK